MPSAILCSNMRVQWSLMLIVFCVCICWPANTHASASSPSAPKNISVPGADAPRASGYIPWRTDAAMMHMAGGTADLRSTALLTATLAVNTRAAAVGGTLVYTLTLVNNNAVSETFDITDRLPLGLMLVDAPDMTVSGQTVTVSGALDSGMSRQFVVTTRVDVYHSTIEHAATVRFGEQTWTVAAPVVHIASAGSSSAYYLPLIIQ